MSQQLFIPDRGDVLWLDLDPQAGHEQAGRRPVLVLSRSSYNGPTGLALICPITNRAKGYISEVAIPMGFSVTGVVLSDQLKSVDWQARQAAYLDTLPDYVIRDVANRVFAMIL